MHAVVYRREEELPELEQLIRANQCPHAPKGGVENKQGKANVLIQASTEYCMPMKTPQLLRRTQPQG